ncbi:MAG TPA: FAD-binding oxidoreductase [Dermatophilaceae bacterium]|nr:FAD-binding oxidoreductase [Dermatophilaceae bacterium]
MGRSWWGWGTTEGALSESETAALVGRVQALLPGHDFTDHAPPAPDALDLPEPRVAPPDGLRHLCSADPGDRAGHAHGKAFRDVVRNLEGRLDNVPDLVVRPRAEQDVVDVLEWCTSSGIPVVPYGGGSSVVGGVEPRFDGPAVTLDLARLGQVLEVDPVSRCARIQAGTRGPSLEDQLRGHGLTLRHYPQSFEFSTLGGWLATRAGGHFATLYTHVDDLTESMRVVTPAGVVESLRVPASGAGPSPDRLFLGSEGTLGVITEAWMRLHARPVWRATVSLAFDDFWRAVEATRAIAQAGLLPSNCRLLDATEAFVNAGIPVGGGLLLVGFESADHSVEPWLGRALEIARDHGGSVRAITDAGDGAVRDADGAPYGAPGGAGSETVAPVSGVASGGAPAADGGPGTDPGPASGAGPAARWRSAFLRMPYQRDALARRSMVVETFETACTWDRFESVHASVTAAARQALVDLGLRGVVTCRLTHVYPDGPAPYFGVFAAGTWGSTVQQWDAVKAAVSEAILAGGATITHHHAVGRDHLPWYHRQRPDPFAAALRAAKAELDPAGILNPGVLW